MSWPVAGCRAAAGCSLADARNLQLLLDDVAELGVQHGQRLASSILLQKLFQACDVVQRKASMGQQAGQEPQLVGCRLMRDTTSALVRSCQCKRFNEKCSWCTCPAAIQLRCASVT